MKTIKHTPNQSKLIRMIKLLKIVTLMLVFLQANAESFTVLAKSGVNIRKEPNSNSQKIGTLAFGTIVEAEIDYEKDIKFNYKYKHFTEIIEGKQGFWVKISYGKVEGFIFSGFGLIGEWVVGSTEINRDFRILRAGKYCGAINYDPKLNWFALSKENGKLYIKKSEVTLRIVHEFNEQDTLGSENEYWTAFPLIVKSNLKDTILFLIGTKTELEEGAVCSQFIASEWNNSEGGKFLFPEQTHNFNYNGKNFHFHAFERVRLTSDNPDGYVKNYQIELKVTVDQLTVKKYNLSEELELQDTAERHCGYKTPQLILVGDINRDGLPDFIFYSHTMSDSCEFRREHHLFLSDKSNNEKPVRRVANDIGLNCIT